MGKRIFSLRKNLFIYMANEFISRIKFFVKEFLYPRNSVFLIVLPRPALIFIEKRIGDDKYKRQIDPRIRETVVKKITMRYKIIGIIIIFTSIWGYGQILFADTVTLKNGQKIEGITQEIGSNNVEIKTRTTRLIVPKSSIEKIEKNEYKLEGDAHPKLTPEQIRRKNAEQLFQTAQKELDKLNVLQGIGLLEKAVEEDPGFDKGLESLIRLVVKQKDFAKAKKYLDQLKNVMPLAPEFETLTGIIEEESARQMEKEKTSETVSSREMILLSPSAIPKAPPAANYTGVYYIEYSYYAQVQQSGEIASVAVYSQNPNAPLLQISATVRSNYIIFDLSRIQPSFPPESVYAVIDQDQSSFSLNYQGSLMYFLGKKMNTPEELEGFKQLLSGNPQTSLDNFNRALQKDPHNCHVLFGLGRAQMFSDKSNEAIMTFENLAEDPIFSRYFFMEKMLNISLQYTTSKIMSAKGLNALDDYETAIRQFPLRVPNFSPLLDVLDTNASLNPSTAEEAKKLLAPYEKTFQAIEDTYQKSYCHWPVTGSLGSPFFHNTDNYIILAKLLLIRAKLACFENRFKDGLAGARRVLQMGHHMIQGPLHVRLLGFNIEKMGIETFRELICFLNTPEETDEMMKALKGHLKNLPPYDYLSLISFERVEWPGVEKTAYTEASLLARVNLAQISMLPIAAGAKKYFLIHKQWPASLSMLDRQYLEGDLPDPFGRESFKIFFHPDGFRIYSLGPDRTDNNGNLPYNPMNGINSAGDILMDIR